VDDLLSRLETGLGDRYRILHLIGEGGMARVYLARDLRHEREVALKVLRPEIAASLGGDRFLREIRIVASLQHPNVLPLFDSGVAGDSASGTEVLWYVMPYVQGESLRAKIEREGRLSLEEVVRIGDDLAGALDYAHGRGVVHRDVKPENVLLSGGHAFVADFGVARAVDLAGTPGATAIGIAMGTPTYMSPEQAAGEADLDGRSDVYSLACVFYEMLAGTPPFGGVTPREIMAKHALEPPLPIRRERPDLSPVVEAALSRGLAKAPGGRTLRAADLVRELRPEATPIQVTSQRLPVVRRSRSRVVPVAVAGAALAAVALIWRARAPAPLVPPSPSASAIAVLPFTVRGADSLGLGEGLVGLLSTKLDGAGDLHSVDPRALLSYVARQAPTPSGPDQGRLVADHFGAGLFVLGDVLAVGGKLRLTASLYDARRPGHTATTAAAEGPTDHVFDLVDSLASQLLAGWSGRESRLTGIAAVTTRSLAALKAYLEGESAFRSGNFDAAVEGFQRAVAEDSLFALAWYRMSVAAEWLTRSDIAHEAAEHAVRLADRLSEHDRLLLQGLVVTRRGEGAEAERLFQNAVAIYPNDVEAWIQLGEVQFHYGPLFGRPVADSKATWQRVLALEPDFFAPLVHLVRIAAAERDGVQVDSLVRRAMALRPTAGPGDAGATRSERLELETLRAFSNKDPAGQAQVLAQLDSATDVTVSLSLWGVASFVGDWDGAARIAGLLAAPSRASWSRAASSIFLANLEEARGQTQAAKRHLDIAAAIDPRAAAEARALLAAAPYRAADPGELAAARDAVARAPDTPEPPPTTSVVLSAHHGLHGDLRTYLLGLLDARLGNATRATKLARELETLPAPANVGSLMPDLARGIRAETASRRGRPAEVTAGFAGVRRETYYELATTSPFFAQARERFVQAEALVAQGRDAEATALYRSLGGQGSMFELPYLAPAQLRLGEIAERQGRADEAADHYARVLELWRDADPPLQPLVREARARLAKVRSEK
jgi:eukaryotic-like serine/threonine-protein kinase